MLSETLDNFNISNIFILSPIKNNLIIDGLFYKLLYSEELYTSNGIYIDISMNGGSNLNGRMSYDISKNMNTLRKIYNIERYIFQNILNSENNKKKIYYKISDQFKNGNMKLNHFNNNNNNFNNNNFNNNDNNNFILKISGVWENSNSLGISFKLIQINKSASFDIPILID